MNRLAIIYTNPLWTAIIGLVAGVIIGLPVLGWWLLPVQYVDGDPAHLRADYKAEYVRMAADSLALNNDSALAIDRAEAVGGDLESILQGMETDGSPQEAANASRFRSVVGIASASSGAAGAGASAPVTQGYLSVLPYLCAGVVLLASVAGGFIVVRRSLAGRDKNRGMAPAAGMPSARSAAMDSPGLEYAGGAGTAADPPIQRFMTTYALGDDHYDDSFSVDSPSGSFLGECGVGISETIGVGDPKKVTSFEVWLFDKNDIRTVTKVLMSEHAYRDEALRARLSAKGEPVVAEPGESVMMETASLRVTARVVDMAYGGGALPPNSFFERITIELAAWQKPSVE